MNLNITLLQRGGKGGSGHRITRNKIANHGSRKINLANHGSQKIKLLYGGNLYDTGNSMKKHM